MSALRLAIDLLGLTEGDEIITEITFPIVKKAAYQKFKHPASRFAIVGVVDT